MSNTFAALALGVLSFVLTVALVRLAIAYAQHRGMLDVPGRRRSHTLATPRGGGIGIVVGALLTSIPALLWLHGSFVPSLVAAFVGAGVVVAAAGWWDDHRSLPILPRLLAQLLASLVFAIALYAAAKMAWWWLPLLVVGSVCSINLHNFMDGIDGLLGAQSVFVGVALAVLAWSTNQGALGAAALCMAAASVGFLLFNWSPARIFMGDVGSGFMGVVIFMLSALLWSRVPLLLWSLLILSSGFVVDAGLTLLWRMLHGRRWYTAHREHLYQWLVRRGRSHAQTGCFYMLWNLLLVAPMTWMAQHYPQVGVWLCLLVYVLTAAVWWFGRKACLRGERKARGGRSLA